jgi:hypothetical protein
MAKAGSLLFDLGAVGCDGRARLLGLGFAHGRIDPEQRGTGVHPLAAPHRNARQRAADG